MVHSASTRRDFLRTAAAASVVTGASLAHRASAADTRPAAKTPVGIHIAAHSFYDEGIDYCLDLLQETAGVNTLFVASNTYYGAMYRPKEAQGDHGKPIRDGRGRKVTPIFFRPNERHYRRSALRHGPVDAQLEYAGKEIFADLAQAAQKRGIKLYERLYEPGSAFKSGAITGGEKVLVVDAEGAPQPKPCWNHPEYRGWVADSLTDLFSSYPLDGIQYGAERWGPLSGQLLGLSGTFCFCEHCQQRARLAGIDIPRAREGARRMHAWILARKQGAVRPADGVMVEFLRLLMHHPEILLWEKLQYDSLAEIYQLVHDTVKAANPRAHVGRHVDHAQSSYDLFYRAAVPYAAMAKSAEFLKISTYADIMGPRLKGFVTHHYGKTIFGDLESQQALDLFYALSGNDAKTEPKLETLADTGMSPQYVFQETKRAVEGVAGKAAIYSAIAIDIPVGSGWGNKAKPSDPAKTTQSVRRAFDAGAAGIVICREYEEMTLPSLRSIGQALRAIGRT